MLAAESHGNDFPYFRTTWNRVVAALLAAGLLPLVLLGGGMYVYAASVLERSTVASLTARVNEHREAIDRYLAEKVGYLDLLGRAVEAAASGDREATGLLLADLHRGLPAFTDLGVIREDGRHLAYSGPYDLLDKDYAQAPWFKQVMAEGFVVSDVFLGHRGIPHFIIAERRDSDRGAQIIRVTIDAADFQPLVTSPAREEGHDSYLVSRSGAYQTRPLGGGELMAQSPHGGLERFAGVRLAEGAGTITATVWQEMVPWVCVVTADQDSVFADLRRVRRAGFIAFLLGVAGIVVTVLMTTSRMVRRLELHHRSVRFLDHQLRRASRLSSSMILTRGLFEELRSSLATMGLSADVVCATFPAKDDAEAVENLDLIKASSIHCRRLLDRFHATTGPSIDPHVISDVDVNSVLDDLLLLLAWELHHHRIQVEKDFDSALPCLRGDYAKVRQVFQSILLNAIAAVGEDGRIHVRTRQLGGRVEVVFTDSGPGILPQHLPRIFEPLFTTRPDGVGLGLSVARTILEGIGGTIHAENDPALGARFTVEFPIRFSR